MRTPAGQFLGRPGYWTDVDFVDLPDSGDGGVAVVGNNSIIIGQTFVFTPGVGITQVSATLWDQDGRRTISGLEGVRSSSWDINSAGTYVGITGHPTTGASGGFIGRDGSATRLNFPGFPETRVYEINDSGHFVGVYEPVNNQIVRGYVATYDFDTGEQSIRDLGLFPGYQQTVVYANNNDGWIVGGAVGGAFGDFERALIWPPGAEAPLDLNTMVDVPGATLIDAYRINNAGQILAEARLHAGGYAYYRLDPIPEPAGVCVIGCWLLVTGRRPSVPRRRPSPAANPMNQ